MSISGDTVDNISSLGYYFQMNLITTYRILLNLTIILEKKASAILNTFLHVMIA